eukprot:6519086-Pyramimonas_sp.AAC.1
MECARRLSARSAGSFRGEEESGCGMRGAACVLLGKCRRACKHVRYLLGEVSRSHKLARISSFGSELLAARGAADVLQGHLL